MLRHRWLIFGLLASLYFLGYFHRVTTSVMSVYFETSFGATATSLALLSSLYFYAYGLMQLPSGILTDRWGPRRTIMTFILLAPLGILLTATARDLNVLLLGRILMGLGLGIVYVPVVRVISAWFLKDEFASMSGILLAVGNIGAIMAAGPLEYFTANFGWREIYLYIGLLTLAAAILTWFMIRDRPENVGLPTPIEAFNILHEENIPEDPYDMEEIIESIPTRRALRMVFGSGRKFWSLAIWFLLIYGAIITYQGLWAAPFFREVLGWSNGSSALTLSFIGIGIIVGAPASGYLSDKVIRSRKKVLVYGTFFYIVVWLVLWASSGHINDKLPYMILHFCLGFFGGWYVVGFAQMKELFPVAIIGTAVASLNLFPFVGAAIIQQISAVFIGDHSLGAYRSIWFFLLVCLVIAFISVLLSEESAKNP